MKRSLNSLIGYTLGASDGDIGKVKDFYFDDDTWAIRYLIVETGSWLSGRKVLIAAEMLMKPDWENTAFPVNLTMAQVMNSPDTDNEEPVSIREELEWQKYYVSTNYWGNDFYTGGMPDYMRQVIHGHADKKLNYNSHLRSTGKVTGYSIQATDGEVGDVKDFIVNDTDWKIDFLVVDTGHWLPGRKVIISPKLISEIDWVDSEVTVNTSVRHIKDSPEYDPSIPISKDYEIHLHNHYKEFITNIE